MKLLVLWLGIQGMVAAGESRSSPPDSVAPPPGEVVVLLHGLGRTSVSMLPLAIALEREGYDVVNASYPWRTRSLAWLANTWLPARLAPHASAPRIHFVTHSMGGILLRLWLRDCGVPPNLGRVVMLAPPNAGSELPAVLSRFAPARWILGPNASLLGTSPNDLPRALGHWPAQTELGIIAGRVSLNPVFSRSLNPPHDGKVTVASTHLAGEREHLILPFTHTWLGWRTETIARVRTFLRSGTFAVATSS